MARSCLFRLLSVPLLLLLMLAGYEGYRVWQARVRTPQVLAQVADRPLKLSAVPPSRIRALLAVEDPGFYRHHGVDFSTPGAGWTTIAQALVKHLYFDRFAPGFAKIEQSLIARFAFDPAVPKDVQLEIFLNGAYFGRQQGREVFGFEDAARSYYGRGLSEIDDRDYLSLVAMLLAPADYDPVDHPKANDERTARIQALLAGKCRPRGWRDVTYPDCQGPALAFQLPPAPQQGVADQPQHHVEPQDHRRSQQHR